MKKSSSHSPSTVEIETAVSREAIRRKQGRFIKGPMFLEQIKRATVASKQTWTALPLYLLVKHRSDMTGKQWVTLPQHLLEEWLISRSAKSRGLLALEQAGLVQVQRCQGRSARVMLVV